MTHVRIAVAALAGLFSLVLATPAAAVFPDRPEAPCTTGGFTRLAGQIDATGQRQVTADGWIQPCSEPIDHGPFAVTVYYTSGAVGVGLASYVSPATPTIFTIQYNVDSYLGRLNQVHYGPLRALCVLHDYAAPVACAAVDLPADGGVPLVTPISTDDGRVTSVPLVAAQNTTEPIIQVCGNCV